MLPADCLFGNGLFEVKVNGLAVFSEEVTDSRSFLRGWTTEGVENYFKARVYIQDPGTVKVQFRRLEMHQQ